MKKRWIVLGAVVVILVAIVAIAAMNLDAWLDENRGMIEEEAASAVGREVEIGDLGVQLWGGLGVRIEALRVGEDPSYGEGDFLTLDRGVVRVSILPALMGRIELGEIVLDAPRIRVIRDARGLSIDSLVASEETPEPVEEESALDLRISSLRIVDGRVVFEDRTGEEPAEATVEHLDLAVDDIAPDRPLHFDLEARLLGASEPNLFAEGTAGPVLASADTPLEFDVAVRLEALALDDLVRLEDVAAALPEDTRVGGHLDATLSASGVPDDAAFDLTVDATRTDLTMAEDLVKPPGVPLVLSAKGRALAAEAIVEAFSLTLAGARVDGDARAALDESGAYAARIRGSDVPLAGWGELLPAAAGVPVEGRLGLDVRAKGRADDERLPALTGEVTLADVAVRLVDTPPLEKLSGRMTLAGASAQVSEARFEVGGAPMTLEAEIADLNAPEVRFALDAPVLPLAAIGVLEPGTEADDQLRKLRVVGRADARGEALVADARFASPEGRLQGIAYTALEGRASMDAARTRLDELHARLLGGELTMSGTFDESDLSAPLYDGSLALSGIRIEELVAVYFPAAGKVVSGRLDTRLALEGRGLDSDTLLRSLAGTGRISLRDGLLYDVNVAEEVLRGATGVPGLSAWISPTVREQHPKLFETGDTRFRKMAAAVDVVEGRLRTDDLAVDAEDFGLAGGGTIGLDGSVDLRTEFASSPALATSLVGVAKPTQYLLDRKGRLVVPVRVTGSVTRPKVQVDERYIGQALKKAAVGSATSALGGLLDAARQDAKPKPRSKSGAGSKQGGTTGAAPDASGEAGDAASEDGAEAGDDATGQPDLEGDVRRGLDDLFGR